MPKPLGSRRVVAAGLTALSLTLAGCGAMPDRPEVETPPRGDGSDPARERQAVERLTADAVTTLEADIRELLPGEQDRGDPLPERLVGPTFVREMSALELMEILIRPHDIAVVPSPGLKDVKVTLLDPVQRPIGEALDMIAQQASLFYTYRNGVLLIDDKRDFTITLPRLAKLADIEGLSTVDGEIDLLESFAENFEALGAKELTVDAGSGIVNFEADRRSYRRIAEYARKVAAEKSVLVYDTWLYSVTLNENVGYGVDFGQLAGSIDDVDIQVDNLDAGLNREFLDAIQLGQGAGGGAASAATSGYSLLMSGLDVGQFTLNTLLSFLDTQGEVKALSKPSLTMASGRSAQIFVGRKRNFVERIEVHTEEANENNASDDDDQDESTVTPEVSELDLGVNLALAGTFNNGLVTTDVKLKVTDLVKLDEADFSSSDENLSLQLPETSERSLVTQMHSRPGDIIVLGGLIRDQGQYDRESLASVPTAEEESRRREELVMIMRPRVIRFAPAGADAPAEATTDPAPSDEKQGASAPNDTGARDPLSSVLEPRPQSAAAAPASED
jgi:hypothetical protein